MFLACRELQHPQQYPLTIFHNWAIFQRLGGDNFWWLFYSERKVKVIFGYPIDAYHICGSCMWVLIGLMAYGHAAHFYDFVIIEAAGCFISFNLFYNIFFRVSK
jgi:hypothetical protein